MTNKDCDKPIYPCQFPIKVIGDNHSGLDKVIVRVMSRFEEVIDPAEMSITRSRNGKYLSITFTLIARSREHIEQIYSELNAQEEVRMVL